MKAMQMHMRRLRMIVAAGLVLVVSGCGRPNPLIGKWTLADQSGNDIACVNLSKVEFTDKTVTAGIGPTKSTVTVTYGRDGDSYLATAGNGQAYRVTTESGGIEANGCHLIRAIPNPLVGKWKLAPGQDQQCNRAETIEFTDDTMTVVFTEQEQEAEHLSSRISSAGVTYSRDGEFYVATSVNGTSKIKIESGGIEMVPPNGSPGGCHFIPDN
jgi:hypothetical protein